MNRQLTNGKRGGEYFNPYRSSNNNNNNNRFNGKNFEYFSSDQESRKRFASEHGKMEQQPFNRRLMSSGQVSKNMSLEEIKCKVNNMPEEGVDGRVLADMLTQLDAWTFTVRPIIEGHFDDETCKVYGELARRVLKLVQGTSSYKSLELDTIIELLKGLGHVHPLPKEGVVEAAVLELLQCVTRKFVNESFNTVRLVDLIETLDHVCKCMNDSFYEREEAKMALSVLLSITKGRLKSIEGPIFQKTKRPPHVLLASLGRSLLRVQDVVLNGTEQEEMFREYTRVLCCQINESHSMKACNLPMLISIVNYVTSLKGFYNEEVQNKKLYANVDYNLMITELAHLCGDALESNARKVSLGNAERYRFRDIVILLNAFQRNIDFAIEHEVIKTLFRFIAHVLVDGSMLCKANDFHWNHLLNAYSNMCIWTEDVSKIFQWAKQRMLREEDMDIGNLFSLCVCDYIFEGRLISSEEMNVFWKKAEELTLKKKVAVETRERQGVLWYFMRKSNKSLLGAAKGLERQFEKQVDPSNSQIQFSQCLNEYLAKHKPMYKLHDEYEVFADRYVDIALTDSEGNLKEIIEFNGPFHYAGELMRWRKIFNAMLVEQITGVKITFVSCYQWQRNVSPKEQSEFLKQLCKQFGQ